MECTSAMKCNDVMKCNEESRDKPSLEKELEHLHEQVNAQAHLVATLRERLSGLLLPWPEEKRGVSESGRANCPYVAKVWEISGDLSYTTSYLARILDELQV